MIAIVGGGIVGLSIAWGLARQSVPVTVLNAGNRGGEASPAGAGMLAVGGEFTAPSLWLELGLESQTLYPAFVADLSAESGCAIDYRVCGAIELARNHSDRDRLRERSRLQIANGIAVEETEDGLYYPDDGYVDPRHVLAALRVACRKRNVTINDARTVDHIEATGYDALVIAAGAWSGAIEVRARGAALAIPKTLPVKGHLLGYRLQPGSLGPIRRLDHTYILQRADGFTVAGSSEQRVGFDTTVDEQVCAGIQARAAELWPVLAEHTPSDRWIGFRPATEDLLPKIGRAGDSNVWLAYGHYRNGILLAPATARRIAGEITSSLGRG